ncbi:O-antigen ligase family protein [Dactylosporangium sp. NPDC005555]|uniref:O-antigen ligase family protein n=1 Tax=Dactylosporangium sp. NPDC005555 TaxID=3154889 RepID=UPI0033B8EC84
MVTLVQKQDPVAFHIVLIAAATAGVVAQGGFYPPGRLLVTALVAVAFGLALHTRRDLLKGLGPILGTAGAVAAWALLRGVTSGGLPVAAAITASLATLVAAVAMVRITGPAARRWITSGLVGLGTLVAVTGWAGVAWRLERWSVLVESTLWRASSTLTYSNAAAAVLAVTALLALALVLEGPTIWWRPCAAYLTQVGLAATLSRAGALAFAAGLLVLAAAAGMRPVLRHAVPAAAGALVALAALVPSFPVAAAPQPLLALGGLLLGGAVAVLLPRLRLVYVVLAGSALLLAGWLLFPGWDAVLARRATFASRGRSGATSSALDLVAAHPWIGSGPGQGRFFWTDHTGQMVVSRWVHNEYLQWLVDLGAVGLVLLLSLGAALFVFARRRDSSPLWAGAVAAIAALALHSAFDFLWELAVVPLLLGVLVGIAGPSHGEESAPSPNGEETP